MANTIKIAMAQLLVEGGVPNRNLQRAKAMIEKAVEQKADLVVLPETLDFSWTHPLGKERSEPIPGIYSRFFGDLAKKHQIHLCLGLTERKGETNFNAALIIDSQGQILSHYRKVNLLEVEFDYYQVGTSLEVVDLPWGRFGLNICSDNYVDSLAIGESLCRMGAQVILSPCAWTVTHDKVEGGDPYDDKWNRPLHTLAKTFNVIMVSTTAVGYIVGGPYEGMKMMGGSIIVGPEGVIQQGQFNEFAGQLLVTEVTLPENHRKGVEHGAYLKKRNRQPV